MDGNLLLLGFLSVVAVALVVYALMPKAEDTKDQVKRRLTGKRGNDEIAELREKARVKATDDLVKKATPMLSRLVMPTTDQDATQLKLKLATAGFRQPNAQTIFMASKTLLAVAGAVLGLVAGFANNQPMMLISGFAAFGAGAGLMFPNFWLSMACSQRKEKIKHGLPDTLDLLVVSVESGLGLDAALKRVGDEMACVHPELSEEMRIATMESTMGLPRGEALENMAKRTAVEEMRSLISVILQAEKFGTSIARALRNQGDSLRTKRRQAAEERAQKTAVKLMIPLVLFIFPAMGVVLAGPAAINMMKALKDNPTLN